MLRLPLDQEPPEADRLPMPLAAWIGRRPVRDKLPEGDLGRLVLAIRSAVGIEALHLAHGHRRALTGGGSRA